MVRPLYIFISLVLGVSQASLDLDDESPPSPPEEPVASSPVLEPSTSPVSEPSASPVPEPSPPPVLQPTVSSVPRIAPRIRFYAPVYLPASKPIQREAVQVLQLQKQSSPRSIEIKPSLPPERPSSQLPENPPTRLPENLPTQPPLPLQQPPQPPDNPPPQPPTNPPPQPPENPPPQPPTNPPPQPPTNPLPQPQENPIPHPPQKQPELPPRQPQVTLPPLPQPQVTQLSQPSQLQVTQVSQPSQPQVTQLSESRLSQKQPLVNQPYLYSQEKSLQQSSRSLTPPINPQPSYSLQFPSENDYYLNAFRYYHNYILCPPAIPGGNYFLYPTNGLGTFSCYCSHQLSWPYPYTPNLCTSGNPLWDYYKSLYSAFGVKNLPISRYQNHFHFGILPPKSYRPCKMGGVSPVILVHGGAGDIPDSGVPEKIDGVKRAALAGFKVLNETGLILNAIEASINVMEDLEGFNAGRGSVLTLTGEVEMEALITEGKDLKAGAITLAKNIRYPISVARMVMEQTPHTFLGGEGLEDFITKSNIPRVGDDWLITDRARYALEKFIEQGGPHAEAATEIGKRPGDVGTVGSVAVDSCGHVGSGTSTGGITGKYKGRIGDTPQLGSGGYSDDKVGAVSTTGYGEAIMRYNLAHRILSKMETGINAQDATKLAVDGMTERIKKTAGAITVSNSGDVGISFASKRMAWAYVKDGELHYGIEQGQHEVEKL